VVATEAHRASFLDHLVQAGVDVASAQASGGLVLLDANETLDAFMIDGRPDRDRFAASVGNLLISASDNGRRSVRAFGEMVALLWDDDQVTAAIELEDLWNGLAGHAPFSLFCAYPAASVGRAGGNRKNGDSKERGLEKA